MKREFNTKINIAIYLVILEILIVYQTLYKNQFNKLQTQIVRI